MTSALASLALLMALPAAASSSLCNFEPTTPGTAFGVELIGAVDIEAVQVELPDGPRLLVDAALSVVAFDPAARRIRMRVVPPALPGLPAAFELHAEDGAASLWIDGQAIPGRLDCEGAVSSTGTPGIPPDDPA